MTTEPRPKGKTFSLPPSIKNQPVIKTGAPGARPIAPAANPPTTSKGGLNARPSVVKRINTAPEVKVVGSPPPSVIANLEKKRAAVQAKEQARVRGQVELPIGTRFNERLLDDFQPSNPTEAMFYQVFGGHGIDGDPIDDMPFLLADRAMPSPKG